MVIYLLMGGANAHWTGEGDYEMLLNVINEHLISLEKAA